jgi:hypothetical protein
VQKRTLVVDSIHQPLLPPREPKVPIRPPLVRIRSSLHRPTHWMPSRMEWSQILQVPEQRQVVVDFRDQPILPSQIFWTLPIRPPLVQQQRHLHWTPSWMLAWILWR